MSYDPKCLELAKAFLSDHPSINREYHADRIAHHIQDTIEDYIDTTLYEEQMRLAEPPYDTREEKEGLR